MRLAYFSPLPPQPTGIADYSHELLPYLARHADIELFVEEGCQPLEELRRRFPIHVCSRFEGLAEKGRYDAVLYQVGNNSAFHGEMYRRLLRYPGIVVLHEYMLHHLVRNLLLEQGEKEAYLEEMRYCHGGIGLAAARRSLASAGSVDLWRYPLFERAVDASLGVVVHNDFARRRVLASRPLARIAVVPQHFSPAALAAAQGRSREALRALLGLPQKAFVVASFGLLTPYKGLEVSLRAFARLRREMPEAIFLLVGEISPHYDLQKILDQDLAEGVLLVGRVALERFLQYMAATDLALNLRFPTGGESSATQIRLMGLGAAVIVSNVGSFCEFPDETCAKVDLDALQEATLHAFMQRLASDDELRLQMGENARRWIAEHHTLEKSARAYRDFIKELIDQPVLPKPAVPPLAAYGDDDVLTDLFAEVATELTDIGVGEDDEAALTEVASTLVELDLDRSAREARD